MLYALVASDCRFAVDVFVTRALAEEALAEVLADEPGCAPLFSILAVTEIKAACAAASAVSRSSIEQCD